MAEYGIWLSFNNQEEGFQIPINPASIEMGEGNKSKTYDVAGLGEINVIKDRKLTNYSFSSYFPAQYYPFMATDLLLEPRQYVEYLEKWMDTMRPIRFVFTGESFDINTPASIENFTWKEIAGTGGDIEYTLSLKRYIFYAAQRVIVAPATSTASSPVFRKEAPSRPNDKQPPKTYKLLSGDNLWKVSKKAFGSDQYVSEIQRLNNLTDAQLKSLPVGMELRLPEVRALV